LNSEGWSGGVAEVKQEYLCEFGANVDACFSYDEIQAAFNPDVKPLFDPKKGN